MYWPWPIVVKLVKDFSLCRRNIGESSCSLGEPVGLASPTLYAYNYIVPHQWVAKRKTAHETRHLQLQQVASTKINVQSYSGSATRWSRFRENNIIIDPNTLTVSPRLTNFDTDKRFDSYNCSPKWANGSLIPVVGVHGSAEADSNGCKCTARIKYNSQ